MADVESVLARLNAGRPMIAVSESGLVAAQVVAVSDLQALVGAIGSLKAALESIAANTCCEGCQEAARVARAALAYDEKAAEINGEFAFLNFPPDHEGE